MAPMNSDRIADYDSEAGALACVVSETDDASALLEQLCEADFDDLRHLEIFRALLFLDEDSEPLNVVSLARFLLDQGKMDAAGGRDYVSALPEASPSPANFSTYHSAVKDRAARRAIVAKAEAEIRRAHNTAEPVVSSAAGKVKLTLRRPSELLAMVFDDQDVILGDRILALAQSLVIAAAGGLGKSRLLLQACAAIVSGRKFLAFDTGGAPLRWLILQTENSNRRLQEDLKPLRTWLGDDWSKFDRQVMIHTVENDSDAFVSLDSPRNVANIADAIADFRPDVVAVDPLNEFSAGDLNKDSDMRNSLQILSRVCRQGNPQRAIIALHHALTGRGGAAKATGYDRSSFARNSKTLHAWARGQINIAPVDADNNERLVVACGKCSNGREFPSFGIRLNSETKIYECDPSIDIDAWSQEMAGKPNKPLMGPERVAELCAGPMTKAELAKAIIDDCGCVRPSAYRYIVRAEQGRKLSFNKTNGHYLKR